MEIIYGSKEIKTNKNVIWLNENELNIPFGNEAYAQPLAVLNEIEQRVINGTKVFSLFKYSDISLWWFIYPTIFPAMKRSLNFLVKFEEIINEKKPTIIRIRGEFDKLKLIKQICDHKKIQIRYSNSQYFGFLIKKWFKFKIEPFRFQYITLKKYKKRLSLFKSKYNNHSLDGKIIFAVPTFYRRFIYDQNKGQAVKGEYIQDSIINILKKMNFDVVGIDIDYTFRGNTQVLAERLDESMLWFPLEIILENYGKDNSHKDFLKIYKKIINNDNFRALFNFNDISFWDQIEDEFIKLTHLPHLPTYIKLIDACEKFFKRHKPTAVFLPYETGPLALPIIIACQKNDIKTLGIQHGIIYCHNPDYTHNEFRSEKNPYGMPLPDITLLFGDYIKKLLTEEQKYPKDKFVVFGNPVFFNIDNILSSLKSSDLEKKYDLPNKKIILFTSSKIQRYYKYYGKINYDEQVWRYLLDNFANDNDFFVILKPHPDENVSIYEQIMNEYKMPNARIIQGELFELIYASSVIISIISTTIIDAICLRKPVIRVKFRNSEPPIPYDKYGVVLSSELDNLSQSVRMLLNDDETRKNIIKNGLKFIKEQYNVPEEDPELILERILNNSQ
ncbi:MAG: hypothetical protein WEC35_05330 [Nitrosopumilaceae archaeon]